jgi:hypothetical protein
LPKNKPDQVIVHRIELQQKEREILESYTTAYAVKSWSKPFVDIISDNSALLVVSAFVVFFVGDKLDKLGLPQDWPEITAGMDASQLRDWLEIQNLVGAGIGGSIGLALGAFLGSFLGPFGIVGGAGAGGIAGAAAGSYTVEELEDLAVEAEKAKNIGIVVGAMLLHRAAREAKEHLERITDPGGGIPYIPGI